MYEKKSRYYQDYYEIRRNEWDEWLQKKRYGFNDNPCSEIPLEKEDPLEKQLDRLKKDGKLNGRVKTLPKRHLLRLRAA